eukprot:10148-Heterococcus_DN1.PRE.1
MRGQQRPAYGVTSNAQLAALAVLLTTALFALQHKDRRAAQFCYLRCYFNYMIIGTLDVSNDSF